MAYGPSGTETAGLVLEWCSPARLGCRMSLPKVEAYPVGWLPDQKLVIAAFPDGCGEPADVWVVDVVPGGVSSTTLLVTDVDAASVRAAVPDPPQALGDVSLDEFA